MFIYLREEGSYLVYLMCRWASVSRSGYHKVAESGFIRDAETPRGTHYFDHRSSSTSLTKRTGIGVSTQLWLNGASTRA